MKHSDNFINFNKLLGKNSLVDYGKKKVIILIQLKVK